MLKYRSLSNKKVGDWDNHLVTVQEKLDGANASFIFSESGFCAFSRRRQLEKGDNGIKGFYNFVEDLYIKNKDKFSPFFDQYRFFGEWLIPHKVEYPKSAYKNFILFDIGFIQQDENGEKFMTYLHPSDVESIAKAVGLVVPRVFYRGLFTDWESLERYVGKSMFKDTEGEGIVVKSHYRTNCVHSENPSCVKMVRKDFKEARKPKREISDKERQNVELVDSIVTKGRVSKIWLSMGDEGIIDYADKRKNLGKWIVEDCIKEEPNIVKEVGSSFGKIAQGIAHKIVTEMEL